MAESKNYEILVTKRLDDPISVPLLFTMTEGPLAGFFCSVSPLCRTMYVLSFFFFRAFESARERENGGSSRVRGVRYARVRVWREREREKGERGTHT